ncbi:MAG: right-handed parallel beta-helix repeat-containing protein, partial [Ferruginibacter sp.]
MKKMYTSVFNGRIVFLFALAVSSITITAQVPQYFKTGTGTAGNTIPLNQASQKTQLLYTPTDFNTLPISGNVTKIWFRNSAAAATATYSDFKVSFIQNTDPSFPSTSYYTGLNTALSVTTLTVNGNASVGGWFEIPIPIPNFPYDNTKTLIIEIQYTARTGGISTTTSTSVGNKRCSGTSLTATTGTTNTIWNDFGMDIIPGGPCTNPPVPGTITTTANSVCLGVPFTLNVVGGTNGASQTYQWQSAPTATGPWTDIAGQTSSSFTTTQTTSTYYQLVVTCGASVASASILINTPTTVSGTFTINNLLLPSATNFQSFNAAYDYIKCGISGPVIFNVSNGPYVEQLNMTPVPGASASNTVTFNGNGSSINFTSLNTNERAVIKLNGADHITFNDLIINATGTLGTEYGFGVHLTNNADSNKINNCTINVNTISTTTNYAGIVVSATGASATSTGTVLCDFNTFSNNTITGGYYGLTLVGSATEANGGNSITNNIIKDFYQYGMYILGSFSTLIEANKISRPTRTDVIAFQGIYFTNLSVSANVTRNRIFDPYGGNPAATTVFNGIVFTGNDGFAALENKVTNNLIYNLSGSGDVYGISNTSSDNVWYYHNTISMDGNPATSTATSIVRGFYQTTLASGIEFRNNIITISRGGSGTKYAMYFATVASTILSNKNDLYISATTGSNNIGFYNAIAQPTLINWQTASLQDAASISIDPLYANAGAGDFTPTDASVNNLGDPLNILVDINNSPRSVTTPDMGAFEFSPGPCVAPPTPGVASVTPSTICVNNPVALTVSGNSTGLTQTYQWESSPTMAGVYTAISGVLTSPGFNINATITQYYRVAVTCSGNTTYSTPALLTVNPALPANTYTINKTIGTGGLNYASFNEAKAAMACGIAGPVIFNVVSGTGPYDEQLILESIAGTSITNTVTFNGNGNSIRFNPTINNERAVIKLRNTDHIIFDSLVIDATLAGGTYGYGVQLFNDADSNVFRNCKIISIDNLNTTNFAGIVINASETGAVTTGNTLCDANSFDNNTIIGGFYSITCVGSTAIPVVGNSFTRNKIRDFYSYGFYLNSSNNTLVEKNDISRPARLISTTFYGVYLTGTNNSVIISKNKIHNPFDADVTNVLAFYGIYFTGVDAAFGTENLVSNNLIYNVNGEGIQYGLYNTSSNNAWYYHNTVSLDDATSNTAAVTRGFYQTIQADGIDFKNNIITIKRGGTGTKHAIFFNTVGSLITSNNNDFYVNGAGGSNFIGYYGVDEITLADWQAISFQDLLSKDLDPEYANPPFNDYTPTLGAVDNIGTPVGVSSDIVDAVRSATTPDAGAYEFTVPPCTTPPVAGTATVVPNSGICLGTTVILSIAGNSIGGGQTYQWQSAPTATGPWTNIGPLLNNPNFSWPVGLQTFFQVVVTCSSISSTSTTAQVALNPAFLGGVYTIDPANPPFYPAAGSTNFESFTTAVAALDCGITDAVTFNVAAGTYNEQIRMHAVSGTSATKRVTFQSANGIASSVNLTFASTLPAVNYVLKLDSASYISYRNLTITATDPTNGRGIDIANTASFDSITNCIVTVPPTTAVANTVAGIYSNLLKGKSNVIKGNTLNNGAMGIYFAGTAITNLTKDHVIDSNTVNGAFFYGIYGSFTSRIKLTNNTVNVTAPLNTSGYGIYATNCDSGYIISHNTVNINNTPTTAYGIYVTLCNASLVEKGIIAGNTILATTGNTGVLYGMYFTGSNNN